MYPTHVPTLRSIAAVGAGALAALYLLTGSGAVAVTHGQPPGAVPPLLFAAGLFAALTVLLLLVQRRWVWIAGAALQVLLIVMYLVVAAERTPPFEPWGVAVKVLQIGMFAALIGLTLRAGAATGRGMS